VSSLWLAGAAALGVAIGPEDISYPYWQYSAVMKDNGKSNFFDRDWNAPYYTNFRSPSAEGLEPQFDILSYQYRSGWDKSVQDGKMIRSVFPDGSRLYLSAGLSKDDQNYIARKFWAGRWWRWGREVGKWALIALCPVITLFGFGYAAIWIGRGFRSA
jgi:hypothetical protein